MRDAYELRKFKNKMIRRPTKHEAIAIDLLHGFEIKQQVIFGFYILDIVVPSKLLVVEIDGWNHFTNYGLAHDFHRDQFIRAQGLRVLHIKNEDVLIVKDEVEKYGDVRGWEKPFRSALGRANSERSKAIRAQRKAEKTLSLKPKKK